MKHDLLTGPSFRVELHAVFGDYIEVVDGLCNIKFGGYLTQGIDWEEIADLCNGLAMAFCHVRRQRQQVTQIYNDGAAPDLDPHELEILTRKAATFKPPLDKDRDGFAPEPLNHTSDARKLSTGLSSPSADADNGPA